jgi:hypothetical protein
MNSGLTPSQRGASPSQNGISPYQKGLAPYQNGIAPSAVSATRVRPQGVEPDTSRVVLSQ